MEIEVINEIRVNDANELLLILKSGGKPMYQYIYRAAAGVYWDEENHGFKSTSLKEWSCAQWFSHIVSIVQSEANIQLQLGKDISWQYVPKEDQNEIVKNHAI